MQLPKRSSRIPRLAQNPHPQSPFTRSPQKGLQNSCGASDEDQSHMTLPRESHMVYTGDADSGFAGSEFPSRTATRMDSSSPDGRGKYPSNLASSMLQTMNSEDDANERRFVEAT